MMHRVARRALTALAILLFGTPLAAHAQDDRNIAVSQRDAADDRRLALVIGNSAYRVGPLQNPVNDARAMASALRSAGFEVFHVEDGSLREMETAVREFGSALKRGPRCGSIRLIFSWWWPTVASSGLGSSSFSTAAASISTLHSFRDTAVLRQSRRRFSPAMMTPV